MESHKRVLGAIYIIIGLFQVMLLIYFWILFTVIYPAALPDGKVDGWLIAENIPLIRYILASWLLFVSIPTVLSGVGVIQKRKWAYITVLIIGCLQLWLIPIGTAVGAYTIWVFIKRND